MQHHAGDAGGELCELTATMLGQYPLAVTLVAGCKWRRVCDTCGQATAQASCSSSWAGSCCKGSILSYQYVDPPIAMGRLAAELRCHSSAAFWLEDEEPETAPAAAPPPAAPSAAANLLFRCHCGWTGACASAAAAAEAHAADVETAERTERAAASAAVAERTAGAARLAEDEAREAAAGVVTAEAEAKMAQEELRNAKGRGPEVVSAAAARSVQARNKAEAAPRAAEAAAKRAEAAEAAAATAAARARVVCPFAPVQVKKATYYACGGCGWTGKTREVHDARCGDCTSPEVRGFAFSKAVQMVSCVECGADRAPWCHAGERGLVVHAERGCAHLPVVTPLPSTFEAAKDRCLDGEQRRGVTLATDGEGRPTRERVWITYASEEDGGSRALRHDGVSIPLSQAECAGKRVGDAVEIELGAVPARVLSKQAASAWEAKRRAAQVKDCVEGLIHELEWVHDRHVHLRQQEIDTRAPWMYITELEIAPARQLEDLPVAADADRCAPHDGVEPDVSEPDMSALLVPSEASSSSTTLVPTAASTSASAASSSASASTALVPATRRAALVAAAVDARTGAMAGQLTAAAKRAGSAAICGVLRGTLQQVDRPGELLELVGWEQSAVGTARNVVHALVTGTTPERRAVLRGEDGAPWPSNRSEFAPGYAIYATGLDGSDPEQNTLAQFLKRYAAQAIARRFHCSVPPLVLFKPSHGCKKGVLCMLMCAADPRTWAPFSILHALSDASLLPSQARGRRMGGHPGGGDGRGRRGARGSEAPAGAGRRRVERGSRALQG